MTISDTSRCLPAQAKNVLADPYAALKAAREARKQAPSMILKPTQQHLSIATPMEEEVFQEMENREADLQDKIDAYHASLARPVPPKSTRTYYVYRTQHSYVVTQRKRIFDNLITTVRAQTKGEAETRYYNDSNLGKGFRWS